LYGSDNAIYDFSKKAVENGLDIFRVFDSLNYIGMWTHFGLPPLLILSYAFAENVGLRLVLIGYGHSESCR
jgi:hypothetical protein